MTNAFIEACERVGIVPVHVPADGKWHSTAVEGKRPRNGDGRIRIFTDGSGGMVQNWCSMETPELFWNDSGKKLSPAERSEHRLRADQARRAEEEEREKEWTRAAATALNLWEAAQPVRQHPYLMRKRVGPTNMIRYANASTVAEIIGYCPQSEGQEFKGDILVVPIGECGRFSSVEMIDETGRKTALARGKKAGQYWATEWPPEDGRLIVIGEGVATVLSAVEALGCTGVAALSCHNLKAVARSIRKDYPFARIIILSDIGNGEDAAREAARQSNCLLARAKFPEGSSGTDFNDLHTEIGIDEVRRQLSEVNSLVPLVESSFDVVSPDSPDILTDKRLKYYFSDLYRKDVHYVSGIGWHRWDGKRWCTDMAGGLHPLIDEMQNRLMAEADQIPSDTERIARKKNLLRLEDHRRQCVLIEACKTVPSLIIPADQLDRDKRLLNCVNGTLDLRTGQLRQHDRTDLITRLVDIEYAPSAKCPTFLSFLNWAMRGDLDLVAYLQRFFGYCLTGETLEQVLNFWYGTGGNGKSTLMDVLQRLLGDYATCADTTLVMRGDSGSTDNNRLSMLATLRGSRIVTLSEVNDGQKLDEAAIKSFTGGDAITARKLYGDPFWFTPQAKLIGFGNYKPHVRGTDHGIWRRIHLVPFHAVISDGDKDPSLPDKLRSELSGILTWAVEGCLEWQRTGLAPPDAILNAVKEYRRTEDAFQSWLDECCSTGEGKRTLASELINSFKEYSGWKNISERKFGDMLKEKGFQKTRSGKVYWLGISLDPEQLEPLPPF